MHLARTALPLVVALAVAGCSSEPPKNSAAPSTGTAATSRATTPEDHCAGITTYDIEVCTARELRRIDRQRAQLSVRLISEAHQPELLQPFRGTLPDLKDEWSKSESAFLTYRDRTCKAVSVARYPGTMAGIEQISCEISLTRARIAFLRAALDGKGNFP